MALTERLAIVLEAVGAGVVERDFTKVAAAAGKLDKETASTTKGLKGLASSAGLSGNALKGALAGGFVAAGGAAIAFGTKSVQAFYDLGQQVLKFERASGASAETSSKLIAALDDVGISAETGANAMFQLGKRLETSPEKLAKFGIEAAKDAKGNTDLAETLLNVSDAYLSTTDPAQRAALLTAAFGKQGKELIPILEQGRSGIAALFKEAAATGQVFSQDDVNKSEQFRMAIDELHDAVNQFALDAGRTLIPLVTGFAHAATDAIGTVRSLAGAIGDVVNAAQHAGEGKPAGKRGILEGIVKATIDDLGTLKGLWDKAGSIGQGTRAGLHKSSDDGAAGAHREAAKAAADQAKAVTEAKKAADEETKAVDQLRGVLLASTSASRSYGQATRSLTDAQDRLKEANKSLRDLQAQGAVDAHRVAEATRDAASATRALERANKDVASAQANVNKLQSDLDELLSGRPAAEKSAEAGDALTEANLRLRRAQNTLTSSQNHLTKVQADGSATTLELSDAQLDVEQSSLDLRHAQDDVTAATDALNKAQKIGTDASPETIAKRAELSDATDRLKDATQSVADATQNVTDKQAALNAAQAGDPNFNEAVRKRREDVAKATQGVADASYNVSQQAFNLKEQQIKANTALLEGGDAAAALRNELEALATDPAIRDFVGPLLAMLQSPAATGTVKPPSFIGPLGPGETYGPSTKAGITGGSLAGIRVAGMASGGIVKATPGGTMIRAGEGAWDEAVIPLRPGMGGGGGGTVNVYIGGSVVTERALIDAVHEGLLALQRTSGTLGFN